MTEAPYSWNTTYTQEGFDCQLTVRGENWQELKARVDEVTKALLASGAQPGRKIWRGTRPAPGNNSNPVPLSTSRSSVQPVTTGDQNPPASIVVPSTPYRRPVGRPKKIPDTYVESGIEKCAHITTDHAVCGAEGYWEDKDDQFRPGKTWKAWRCPQYFLHQDYVDKHPELAENTL